MGLNVRTKQMKDEITLLLGKPWMQYVWLFLITLLAAALRFYKLGTWSFWIDEIYTVNHATAHFSTPQLILQHIPPNRNWVPVSVILTAQSFNIWGVSELSARLVAAILGIVTIPALYFPVRKIFNTRVALITILLLSVSPWHIEWSQNARGYTTLMLFYWLALFAFYFGIEKDRIVYILLFFVFLYLASSERLIALFILPVLLLYLLFVKFLPLEKPAGLRARNIYILASPVILLVFYQIFTLVQGGNSVTGSILNEMVATFFGRSIESPFTQITFMVFNLGIPIFALSFFTGIYLLLNRNRQGLLITISAFVPFFLIVIITPFMFTEERYAFVTLPGWLMLAALGIDQLLVSMKKVESLLAIGVIVVLLADAMGANLMYFHTNNGNRRDFKGAFAIVRENMREGDIVVSTWPELGNYYMKQEVLLWQDFDVETITNIGKRVWFVVIPDMAWFTGTEDFYWWVAHHTRMIKTIYIRTIDNVNIEVYLFDPAINKNMDVLK